MQFVPAIISNLSVFQISKCGSGTVHTFQCPCAEGKGMNPPGSLQCWWPWELRAPAKPRTWHLMVLRRPIPSKNHLAQLQFHSSSWSLQLAWQAWPTAPRYPSQHCLCSIHSQCQPVAPSVHIAGKFTTQFIFTPFGLLMILQIYHFSISFPNWVFVLQ